MRTSVRLGVIVSALVLVGGVACNDRSPEAMSRLGPQVLSDSIEAGYERLQQAYDSADTLPPTMRRMHGAMGQMHGQMRGQQNMGGMHERGERHGGRGMHDGPRHDGRRRGGMRDSVQMWEWHQQMMGMHAQMSQMHEQSGRGRLAKQHRQMERQHRQMMGALPSESEPPESGAATETRTIRGEDLYVQHCASCHGRKGNGLGNTFPPLAGAEWVEGEEDSAIRILLHGPQGQIQVKGQSFDGVMPAFGRRLSDEEVAAVLSYVRSSWGNEGETIASDDVREIRRQHAGRTQPWAAAQLRDER